MQYIMVYSISHKDLHIVFFKVFLQSMLEGALFIYIIRNQRMKLFIIKKEISILVYLLVALYARYASKTAIAAAASITGTARGTMQGS